MIRRKSQTTSNTKMRTELHNIEYKRELTPELEREVVAYLN